MFRRAVVCLGIVACLTCLIGAQEEETVLGKKRSEWLKLLKGSKEAKFRRASLIALEVIGPKAGGVVDGILEALDKDADADVPPEAALPLRRIASDPKPARAPPPEAFH